MRQHAENGPQQNSLATELATTSTAYSYDENMASLIAQLHVRTQQLEQQKQDSVDQTAVLMREIQTISSRYTDRIEALEMRNQELVRNTAELESHVSRTTALVAELKVGIFLLAGYLWPWQQVVNRHYSCSGWLCSGRA